MPNGALALLPPISVAAGGESLAISRDGTAVFYQVPSLNKNVIWRWDLRTRKANQAVTLGEGESLSFIEAGPLPGSAIICIFRQTNSGKVRMVYSVTNSVSSLGAIDEQSRVRFNSKKLEFFEWENTKTNGIDETKYRWVNSQGLAIRQGSIPTSASFDYDEQGNPFMTTWKRVGGKLSVFTFRVVPQGDFVGIPPDQIRREQESSYVTIASGKTRVGLRKDFNLSSQWVAYGERYRAAAPTALIQNLGSTQPSQTENKFTPTYALITSDGNRCELSEGQNAVVYESQGSLMIRPILNLNLVALNKLKNRLDKDEVMAAAKQAGTAIQMYTADYDDVFPDGTDFTDKLNPYMMDLSLLSRVNYIYGGGSISGDPSKTQLGYVVGSSGRALIFGDGHVEWQPNP